MKPYPLLLRAALASALVIGLGVSAQAQGAPGGAPDPRLPGKVDQTRLSGPRFGMTFLSPEFRDSLSKHDIEVASVITQFGWQFEKQFLGTPGGLAAVNEWVLLIGGLDQGAFLPSASWIVGLRGANGAEIGVGPNLSAAGLGLVASVGMTYRTSTMNIPLNFAIVPAKTGPRISLLTGFTLARK
jgi:hypothetical protein